MGTSTTALRNHARWLIMHRGVRTVSTFQAKRGNPLARFLFAPGARANPYPIFEELRSMGRLADTPLMKVTVDHALASGVLRDSQNFGVAFSDVEGMPAIMRWAVATPDPEIANIIDAPSLLAVDPPSHTRYRRLVTKPFTPRAIQKVADRVEERAVQLLDGLEGRRYVDIVAEYANLLPVAVIAEILGVPEDMHQQFLAWGHDAAPVLDLGLRRREYKSVNRALEGMNVWFDEHFANLRRNPGEDILSQLVNGDADEQLTDLELRATAMLLLGAGFETTVNLLGSAIAVLTPDEKSRSRLAAEPDLWPQAVDEVLRLESPVQLTGRVSWQDTEVDGVEIPKGTPIVSLLGGCNRDPKVFDDPDVFDLDRPNSREHIAFSAGIHYCLGANLARMEAATGLRLLFERFPHLTLTPGGGVQHDMQALRGYRSLWVDLEGS